MCMNIFIFLALAGLPGLIGLGALLSRQSVWAKMATSAAWLAFAGFFWLGLTLLAKGALPLVGWGFRIDLLGLIVLLFILFVAATIHLFSLRYMAGDRLFNNFFSRLGFLTSSLLLLIAADHLVLMLFFWVVSNALLATLMIHKREWSASRNSGILMFKCSLWGAGALTLAISILFYSLGSFSLHEILEKQDLIAYPLKLAALLFLIFAALIQSGLWPFHKWLLSSLNSPTPVSGLMHAGLVNGGGFLLVRFAPLFSEVRGALDLLFVFGLISLILGTAWKLIQPNIKMMLASSTIAQMGFMLMQCGLGLFSAAIAHLFWHGFFKCYLFLNAGSAFLEKRESNVQKSRSKYLIALLAGFAGAYGFTLFVGGSFYAPTTQIVLVLFAWLASAQLAYAILPMGAFFALGGSFFFGIIYGSTVSLVKSIILPLGIDIVLPLAPIHLICMAAVIAIFVGVNFNLFPLRYSRRLYMEMLNLSQSDPKTATSIRNKYAY